MAHQTSSDPNVFILPDLGEGVHEAELIKWRVKPGDSVDEHDILADMETDKAIVEVPSPRAGVIATLHGNEGEILHVGKPLVTYEGNGGGAASQPRAEASAEAHAEVDAQSEREDAGTVVGNLSASPGVQAQEGKALATPAVRRIARDLGVDINSVAGTGLAGRVTERDVRAAAEGGGAPASRQAPRRAEPSREPERMPAAPPAHRQRAVADANTEAALAARVASGGVPAPKAPSTNGAVIPFRGTRRTIAQRLRQSMDTAVHFTVMDEAEISALDDVRRKTMKASGEKISFLPFVISAVCRAMQQFPSLNATVDDERQEITQHAGVHMGMATDTEHGLSVPVIPDADMLGVLEIGRHITELARMTRERSIPRDRLMGSTFTISNVGSYAGRFATPVINYPEVAILAVGRMHEGVVAKDGAIRIGKLLPLSLACDHRVVDGAEAARCLAHIIELLGKPQELLTPARG
ncbi:MAG: dihydrolipoamide acetyltransferase family protein [Planctomycetota bacterium]|nr:dihydrolipoamide acetyltransferase family protein [Planctomycetota bacterium]